MQALAALAGSLSAHAAAKRAGGDVMYLADVAARVAKIRALAPDYEAQHAEEDKLYREILVAIAEGRCPDPASFARIALYAAIIDFPRHCA